MRNAHFALFFVVFIDLLGLGILAPLIPFYVKNLGTTADVITLVIAAYSLAQFIGTPFWGSISDRIGRRPVLMISMLGHAVGYLILGYANSLILLVLARVIGGFTSANLATAYAYIADTTSHEDRSKNLGRISAAFGLGFIFGPVIGGFLASVGVSGDEANFVLPALTAMGLSLASCVGIFLFIKESAPLTPHTTETKKQSILKNLGTTLKRPEIMPIIMLCLMVILFVAARESIFPLWANAKHGFSITQVSVIISCGALTLTIIQLFVIGKITRIFGEEKLIKTSIICFAIAWAGLAVSSSIIQIIIVTMIGSFGLALFQTSIQSVLSKLASPSQRGVYMSTYQATSSMARFTGQAISGSVYMHIGRDIIFFIGSLVMVPALIIAHNLSKKIKNGVSNPDKEKGLPHVCE